LRKATPRKTPLKKKNQKKEKTGMKREEIVFTDPAYRGFFHKKKKSNEEWGKTGKIKSKAQREKGSKIK